MAEVSVADNGFCLGAPVRTKTGAVITPILVDRKKLGIKKYQSAETKQLLEYLKKNSWGLCRERSHCIEVAIEESFEYFSCEKCPKKGKAEFLPSWEEMESSFEGCWALLFEIFEKK